MKRCSTCKHFFPPTMFGPDKRKRDGLQPQCRTCRRITALKYTKTDKGRKTNLRAKKRYRQSTKGLETERRYKQTEKYKAYARRYTANYRLREDKQDILRRLQQSPKRKTYNAAYWKIEKNKLRMQAHQRRYNQSEKGRQKLERQRQSTAFRAWFKTPQGKAFRSRRNYIRRAQVKAAGVGKVTAAEWQAIKDQFDNACAYCGTAESPSLKLTQDHLIPVSKLGPHMKDNVVPACQVCNSRKGAKIITRCP
jgi:5-methylcytosine-specific restriction endonuclease McrA